MLFLNKGSQEKEVNERIVTRKLFHALKNQVTSKKAIAIKTKLSVFRSMYRPVLTFGEECMPVVEKNEKQDTALEMKCLRRAKGVTIRDHITNEQIREEQE